MKHRTFFTCLLALGITACNQTPANSDTEKPTVTLQADQSTFTAPGTVKLTATANDNTGVVKVVFKKGNTTLFTDTTSPYETTDPIVRNGTTTYTATAYDAAGNAGISTPIEVTASGLIDTETFAQFGGGEPTTQTLQGGNIEPYQYAEKAAGASIDQTSVLNGTYTLVYTVKADNSYGGAGLNIHAPTGTTHNLGAYQHIALKLGVNAAAVNAGKTTLRVFVQDGDPNVKDGCFPFYTATNLTSTLQDLHIPTQDSTLWQIPGHCDPSKNPKTYDQVKNAITTINIQADGMVGVTSGQIQVAEVVLKK